MNFYSERLTKEIYDFGIMETGRLAAISGFKFVYNFSTLLKTTTKIFVRTINTSLPLAAAN